MMKKDSIKNYLAHIKNVPAFLRKIPVKWRGCILLFALLFCIFALIPSGKKPNHGITIDHVLWNANEHTLCIYYLTGKVECRSDGLPGKWQSLMGAGVDLLGDKNKKKDENKNKK